MTYYEATDLLRDGYLIRRDSWENQNAYVGRIGNIDITNTGIDCCKWVSNGKDEAETDWSILRRVSDTDIKRCKCKYLSNTISLLYTGPVYQMLHKIICLFIRGK